MSENKPCIFHDKTEEQISDHEGRIRLLEHLAVKTGEQMGALIDKMDNLLSILKVILVSFFGFVMTTGVTFIVWYIQSLPR